MASTTVLVPDELGVTILKRHFAADDVTVLAVDGQDLPDAARGADVFIPDFTASEHTLAMVKELPNLRLVQLLTSGAEGWVGRLPAGVMLSSARGAHSGATAEWVVAVLLHIYRELAEFDRARKSLLWDHRPVDTLAGKRILGVGAGYVAWDLRHKLRAFNAPLTFVAESARSGVHGSDELPELIPRHDAVVLMAPLTPRTAGMVDAAFLAAMPDGAVLVNAARGPLVDTEALLAELMSGRLRAALDVTDPEPLPTQHPMWRAPGLTLTPHVGGHVRGSAERAYAVAADQIRQYREGAELRNLVRGDY